MPLHELYHNKAKQKLDPSPIDHSSLAKNDLFELVWEKGQISMQGQSSRAKKIPSCKTLPSHSPRRNDHEKQLEYSYPNTKMGKFDEDLDDGLNEVMIPWLNYGMDDSFQHEYSSNFLHELSGVTMNDFPSSNNNFSLLDRRSNKQGNNNINNKNNNTNIGEIITQIPPSSSSSGLKIEKHGQVISSNSSSSTIMNFTHFAKPAAIVKANLQNIGSRSESVGIKNKFRAAANRSNLPESTKVDSSEECQKKPTIQDEQVDLKQSEPKTLQLHAAECNKLNRAFEEDASKIDQALNIVVGESLSKKQEGFEKSKEPAVVSSSVCSDNGAERSSDGPNWNLKRKSRDAEESDCHSEDVEEESVGVKKTVPARGGKRSRSAEVHNLSERRRRDRINERMRALQELIPNCNKADKASMLDEAIEYLKTLQLQLQIMSMGAGLYMPTMMLPMGMQTPHISPFSPIGMQMGLGMGYGMNMPDVRDGSSSSSRFPMQQGNTTHLPVPHAMARSNPQLFGIPSQGLTLQMPRAPPFPFPVENLMNPSAQGMNVSATAGVVETVDLASGSGLKDPMSNVNSQVMQNNSTNQILSKQCEATTGGFEHSSNHVTSSNDRGAVNLSKEDNLVTDKSKEL